MSIIEVYGNYEGQAFVLRQESGEVYERIEPNTVIGIGKTNNYFVKRVWWGGAPMVALITLSANTNFLDIAGLKRKSRIQKGFILKPGKGLWATSSESAKHGVWHRIMNVNNPILNVLWSHKLSASLLQTVSEIDRQVRDGGNFCEHSAPGSRYYYYAADGSTGELMKARYAKHGRHQFCQIRESLTLIIGGTYCIQTVRIKTAKGKSYLKILFVLVTSKADKSRVAKIINGMMK